MTTVVRHGGIFRDSTAQEARRQRRAPGAARRCPDRVRTARTALRRGAAPAQRARPLRRDRLLLSRPGPVAAALAGAAPFDAARRGAVDRLAEAVLGLRQGPRRERGAGVRPGARPGRRQGLRDRRRLVGPEARDPGRRPPAPRPGVTLTAAG